MGRRPNAGQALASLAFAALLGASGCAPEPARPNVLLVTLDTTRADHLSAYGYARPTSPHFDELVAEGALFENAVAQASLTPVSHAAILSASFPFRNGLRFLHGNVGYRMHAGTRTLAHSLSEVGYETVAFVSALPAGLRFGLEKGFESFDDPFAEARFDERVVTSQGVVNTGSSQRRALETNQAVFDWLAGRPRHAARPFFAWVHYFDPHDVHVAPREERYLLAFADRPAEELSLEERDLLAYDGEILYMDEQLGALLERLRELERPLLVAVIGDHGQGLGDHDWWSHGLLYQEQIRVPLVLSGPGVPRGRRIAALVRSVDVAPTLLSLVGVDPEQQLPAGDGVDLAALLEDPAADLGLEAYAEAVGVGAGYLQPHERRYRFKTDELYSLTRGPWKYIHHRRAPEESELYHLGEDPAEQTNRLATEADEAARLRARLTELAPFFDAAAATRGPEPSDAQRRQLEALGYLEEQAP